MDNNYEVVQIFLESVAYNLLIFKIPEEDLNDKLTYFTREKGLIARSLYEDFLIANCVSNITEFLQHLHQKGTDIEQLNEIRKEIVDKVLELNPVLIPSNIVVNTNYVVKIKEGKKKDSEKLITSNEFWKKDTYKDQGLLEGSAKKLDTSKVKNVKDLPYEIVQKFWRRIGRYVNIKKFEPGSEVTILGDRGFDKRTSFEQYVITMCIEEIEDLFMQLDKIGLPNRVSPPILIHELYEICRKVNTFLDFDLFKDIMDGENEGEEEKSVDPFESFHGVAKSAEDVLSETLKKKKRIKLFRDVPKESLLVLDEGIKNHIMGQDEAIMDLVEAIQRASVGLKDPDQPIGSFIFTGYTGVGKTYTAKILAKELIGSKNNLITIDCSEYSADHEYAKLIGAPSGYIGHEQGGQLTNAIKKNPFSIVLFDEVEKASDKVHQLLLQIMDEGRLTDGKGHSVSFRDTILVMTSNLGVSEVQKVSKTIGFGDASKLTHKKRVSAIEEALKKKFKPEFINRITRIVNFNALTKKDYMRIIKLELDKLKKNLRLNRTNYSKISLKFDRSLHSFIYKIGIDEKFGARPLQRAIEREISTPIAKKLLSSDIDCENTKITVSAKKGDVHIDMVCKVPVQEIADPPFYMKAGQGE